MKARILLFSIIILGIALRASGLFHDFWLDEIWTFLMVSELESPVGIFTELLHDNNHHLNSLYIFVMGTDLPANWVKYRLLSFFCGIAAILMIYLLGKRIFSSKGTGVISAFLAAISYPLILYSVEARGYSPLIFFSLASLYLLIEYLATEKPKYLFLFYLSFLAGMLSHLQFTLVAAGLFFLACADISAEPVSLRRKAVKMLRIFFAPAALALIILAPFLLHYQSGGAPILAEMTVINSFVVNLFGCTTANYINYAWMALLAAVILSELRYLSGRDTGFRNFIIMMILIPAALLLTKALTGKVPYLRSRHFIVAIPFIIIVLSHFLFRLMRRPGYARLASIVIVSFMVIGTLIRDVQFLKIGRGRHFEALSHMSENSDTQDITVTSDHDFRVSMTLRFYAPYFAKKNFVYIPIGKVPADGAGWFIKQLTSREYYSNGARLPESIGIRGKKASYKLEKEFPSFSGIYWALYRNTDS
ncbi:glycosyltransferase family 39 protein [Candidatus Omnitrophota bacterium]